MIDFMISLIVISVKCSFDSALSENRFVVSPARVGDEDQFASVVNLRDCFRCNFYASTAANALREQKCEKRVRRKKKMMKIARLLAR